MSTIITMLVQEIYQQTLGKYDNMINNEKYNTSYN